MKTQQLIPNPTAQAGSSKISCTARYFFGPVLAFLLIQTTTTFAQNVTIPDANFKAALVGNASINTNLDTEFKLPKPRLIQAQ